MLHNKKGFTGIEIAVVMVAIAVIGYFAMPPTIKAAGTLFSGGDKNQRKQVHKLKEARTSFYQDAKGNFVPAPKQDVREIEDMNYNSEAPKATLWDILKKWAFLIGALCLIFPSFGIWLYTKLIGLKNNFNQLVTGIEQAKKIMPPEAVKILETSLSKKTNLDTKALVKKVKANIKEDDLK